MRELDHESLIAFLETMDRAGHAPQRICVIGAASLILLGQPARQTGDIDVWRPGSKLVDTELRQIAAAAGLAYNPTGHDPEGAYLQIIGPGIVNLPAVEEEVWATGERSRVLWQGNNITVICPPPPIIAASKLVRATEVDVDDVVYLMGATGVSRKQIIAAADFFPELDRQFVRENISIVDAMRTASERRQRRRTREEDQR